MQSHSYWSSSSDVDDSGRAWYARISDRFFGNGFRTLTFYVWPVRSGQ